jgi:hypothetical protein
MYCKDCGNQIADNSKFCPVCGSNLAADTSISLDGEQKSSTNMKWEILSAVLPALICGFMFYFLIALTQGMNNIGKTSAAWFLIGFIVFGCLFIFVSNGERILGRFFKYLGYEFWASPVMMIIYSIASVGQASQSSGVAGGIGAGIGGVLLVILTVIIGGFAGLILFLIGNAINRRNRNEPA